MVQVVDVQAYDLWVSQFFMEGSICVSSGAAAIDGIDWGWSEISEVGGGPR